VNYSSTILIIIHNSSFDPIFSSFDIGSLRQEAAKLHPENETENRLGTWQADL
jgi:hypothetical protein